MAVTNKQLLEAIESLRTEELAAIRKDLERFNGRIRFTEQSVASIATWRKVADDEIKALRGKTNIGGTILAVGQLIIAVIGAALLGEKGP